MTEQLALVDVQPTAKLTDRQARALTILQAASPEGMRAIELGQAMGSTKHAKDTGLELARALRKKGQARQRRGGVWAATQPTSKPDAMPPGMTDEIPF